MHNVVRRVAVQDAIASRLGRLSSACGFGTPASQPTQELDDEELLLELPLLRLCTDGTIVKSPTSAPGRLPKTPNARASSNNSKSLNPTIQRDELEVAKKTFLNVEGWGLGMTFHR